MRRVLLLIVICSMLGLSSLGKAYKIVYVFPKGTQLKIGNKHYKLHDTICSVNANFTKSISIKKSLKKMNFSFTIRDIDTKKDFTYSSQYSKIENNSLWDLLVGSFNNYCKNNGAMTKGADDDKLCDGLVINDENVIDTIKSLNVIDQYHIKNIEYKRDTTILMTDSVDIRVDRGDNFEFYLLYVLKNGTKVEKMLLNTGDYVKIYRTDCQGLTSKRYPKGIEATLIRRNVRLNSDNENRYPIRIIPLYE